MELLLQIMVIFYDLSLINKTIHFVNHTVNKLWENGSESSVEVQLLKDGTPYGAPIELNDANCLDIHLATA